MTQISRHSVSSAASRSRRPTRGCVIAVALSCAAMLLVAACSSASSQVTPQQALLTAATQTQQVTSATETLTVKDSTSGSTTTGTFQVQVKPALMLAGNLDVTAAGTSQQITMVLNDTAIYFSDPALNGPAGKPWEEIDLSALGTGGASLAQLFHSLQSNNFTNQAQLSTVAKNARVVGTQTVDGVSTTEYAGSFKAATALQALPASFRQALAPELQALGNSTVYFDEWVDGQNHMRKLGEVETVNGDTVNTTINVSAINQPVHITLPPASQTYSLPGISSPVSGKSGGGLSGEIVPAPPGYAQVPGSGDNGPISAADFNQVTPTGSAASLHFVRGYGASYASITNGDAIWVSLFQFATAADATAFEAGSLSASPATPKADLIIPGAVDYDATSPSQGTYTHAVSGTKGNMVFGIDAETGSAAPVPVVEAMARQQYASL